MPSNGHFVILPKKRYAIWGHLLEINIKFHQNVDNSLGVEQLRPLYFFGPYTSGCFGFSSGGMSFYMLKTYLI